MTDQQCWHIIDLALAAADGTTRRHADVISRHLATRPAADIVYFGSWVRTKMRQANIADLSTAVQWIKAANGIPEVSGNSWEFARAWLVGRGRADFHAAMANADTLADAFTTYDDFCEGESIELAAHRAYEAVTGSRKCPDAMYKPNVVETMPPAGPDAELTAERLVARFPRLTKKFGPPRFA